MPERASPLLPVTVNYACDRCETDVEQAEITDIGRDGLYLHQCPHCQMLYRLDHKYPYQQYVDYMAWLRDCQERLANG